MEAEKKGTVVLVAFYNVKALGVRYLETALRKAGYQVRTIFFKQFNSISPKPVTEKELRLLCDTIREVSPVFVGLSVMSSLYMDSINAVVDTLLKEKIGPIACGGAYVSLFPDYFLDKGVPYICRLDGEVPMVALADALRTGGDCRSVPSLGYREDGRNVINPIGGMAHDLDEYGEPTVSCPDAWLIDNDTAVPGDPQRTTMSYEMVCSRGCPFTCSYCSDVNLRRLNPAGVKPVRFRSVQSVIKELKEAVKTCKNIAFIHFYDEIFPNLPGWVDEFVAEYKKHINLPFSIWTHPKATDPETLRKLVDVGLIEVIMGIQSGSPHIRNDIFHRYETNEEILKAIRTIHESGVFWATYDFILQHVFETVDDIRQSYELVKKMEGRYELQLHSLNFLPGTDIVPMAIEAGYYTPEEMDAVMYGTMAEQFAAFHKREGELEIQLWYDLMYLWQFPSFRKKCLEYEKDILSHQQEIESDYKKAERKARTRYLYKKSMTVIKRRLRRPF